MIGGNLSFSSAPHIIMDDLADSDHSRDGAVPRKASSSHSAAYEMVALEPGFVPTSFDVICARGKEAFNHPGNMRFRALVQDQLHAYSSSSSKMEKSKIVRDIIESVRRASPQGGFVKKVNGEWFDVGERARREKTGQQIRDLLHTQYRSSTKAKARTRKSIRTTGHEKSVPPRSISAPKAASSSSRGSSSSLPARVVTLDSQSRNTDAISMIALQHRMRQNSEPNFANLTQPPGLQSLRGWNLGQQGQQQELQGLQGLQGHASMTEYEYMQQQQSALAEQLQLQHQMSQQQSQLLPQQQTMQQHIFHTDQQASHNAFAAEHQSSFLTMGSPAQLQQQQQHHQQQQYENSSMINNMSNLSTNPFLSAGTVAHAQPFASSNTRPQESLPHTFQQNERMEHRYGGDDLEPIMPVYDNDPSRSSFVEEPEASFDDTFRGIFRQGGPSAGR